MNKKEFIERIDGKPDYGFPYFKKVAENTRFFDGLDIKVRNSDNTFVFENTISDVFGVNDPRFEECFNCVTNGEGNESKKISSIRSSSLLGLMTFYKVHCGRKLEFKRRINGIDTEFSLDEVVFELTNRVFHPSIGLSSIDIALYGTANGKDCVLYLESKFTEYLEQKDMSKYDDKKGVTHFPISKRYEEYYDVILNGFTGIKHYPYEKGIELKGINSQHYCEGIKQMISHYIGATHSHDLYKQYKVYLGTILYDFSGTGVVDKDASLINDYKSCYKELAERLNSYNRDIDKKDDLVVIEDAFTYQDFFSSLKGYDLDEKVKEFYTL